MQKHYVSAWFLYQWRCECKEAAGSGLDRVAENQLKVITETYRMGFKRRGNSLDIYLRDNGLCHQYLYRFPARIIKSWRAKICLWKVGPLSFNKGVDLDQQPLQLWQNLTVRKSCLKILSFIGFQMSICIVGCGSLNSWLLELAILCSVVVWMLKHQKMKSRWILISKWQTTGLTGSVHSPASVVVD